LIYTVYTLKYVYYAVQQSFVDAPSNTAVVQGQTVVLRCSVANRKGAVQWTKGGIALGELVYQKAQQSLEKADRTAYVRSPASDFQSRRESDLSEVTQFHAHYVKGTLLSKAYLQSTLV